MNNRNRCYTALVLSMMMVIPVTVNAHLSDNFDESALDHQALDDVQITPQQEMAVLQRQNSTGTIKPRASFITGQEYIFGKWDGPYDWPVVAVHASLLPNGKVLAYDSVGDGATESFPNQSFSRATLWNPQNNTHTAANIPLGYNIFCSGLAKLSNGQVFIAGGNKNQALEGINALTNFNPFGATSFINRFSNVGTMFFERWYPSVTPLANGEMLITGGGPFTPEIRQLNGTTRTLANINESFAAGRTYHWLKAAPNGRVAYVGPSSQLRFLDTTNGGAWQLVGSRDGKQRSYGSYANYDVGKILVSGGGVPAGATAVKIDLNTLTPSATTSMNFPRRQHNLTILPDGTVLATGGYQRSKAPSFAINPDDVVLAAEVWNPSSGNWTTWASMQKQRAYHSTALLLPDARILSAGGGICGGCLEAGYHQKNAEIFSPPYLFNKDGSGQLAVRPVIRSVAGSINPAKPFSISTPDAGNISKVSLMRMGSVTHSDNMEQNFIPLTFTKGSGTLTAKAPDNNNIAPPGYYMLFLINSSGVPSIAKIIKVKGGGLVTIPQGGLLN